MTGASGFLAPPHLTWSKEEWLSSMLHMCLPAAVFGPLSGKWIHCEKSIANKRYMTGLLVRTGPMAVGLNLYDKTVFLILLRLGEIDIIEGVNDGSHNQMTFHTGPNCKMTPMPEFAVPQGTPLQDDCTSSGKNNAGCATLDNDATSFGEGLNNGGGGIFVALWGYKGIAIWRFTHGNAPKDLGTAPDPTQWEAPMASLSYNQCSPEHFSKKLRIVINTTLCGDWAGAAYPSSCPGTCADAVMNPRNFDSKTLNLLA
jgi:hypothetical protein